MSRLVFISLFLSLPALAAEELEAIQVEAKKESEAYTFGASMQITPNDMERKPLPLLTNQLESVPGLTALQSGGPGGQTSYFMRGAEARHLSFTLDSLRLNDTSNDARTYDAAFLTSPFIAEIHVFKGPQAVLFGSDALGGLIDLRSRKGESAPETRVNVMGGSFGTVQGTIGHDWKTADHQGTFTITQFHTDGVSRVNKKRHQGEERDGAEMTQGTSSSKHRWTHKVNTDLLLSFARGMTEYDAFAADNSKNHSQSDEYILQQRTNLELNKTSSISLRNGMTRHQRYYHTALPVDWYDGNLVQNELLYKRETGRTSLTMGFINEYETLELESIEKSFSVNSVFAQSGFKLGDLSFQAGLRGEEHSGYGSFLIGSAGASYQVTANNLLALQYSQGYKSPSLYQLYAPDIGYGGGNDKLEPERNNSWEARWKYAQAFFEGEVAYFQNRLSNLITWVGGPGPAYTNQGRLTVEGVELSASVQAQRFKLRPSFTHQKFKDNDAPVLRRPQNSAQVQLSYLPVESSEVFVNYRWMDARQDYDEMGGITKLNRYEVIDLGYRYVKERFDATLQVKNIFNREYEDLYGLSVMPRSVYGGVGYRF